MLQYENRPFGLIFREDAPRVLSQWDDLNDGKRGICIIIERVRKDIHVGDWIIGYGDGTYFDDLNYLEK